VFRTGPARHLQTDLAHHGEGGRNINPVDASEIHAGHAKQGTAGIKAHAHTGHGRDVADDVVELDVHLRERLLHMLDVMGRIAHEHGPLAQIAAQDADLLVRAEGTGEQPIGATAAATDSRGYRSCARAPA
jgi:hypothetical protein